MVYSNAGATRFSPIEATSYDDWSFVVRNELDIVFLVTKHAWRHWSPGAAGVSCWSDPPPASAGR